MIEANYGEGVFYEEAVNDLYRENIPNVVDELNIEIVDSPEVEVVQISKESGVTFKARFTVKPEVTVTDYKGIEIEVEDKTVSDADIDLELEKIRADNARIIDSSDTPVKNGDIIKFDFTGFCDGEAFEGGTAENFQLEIGSGKFIPGFEEQVVGKNIGEDFDVNVTFPENYQAENLKGKDAVFKCRIHEKSSKQLAELDDDFVMDISEFDTLNEFREDVRRKLAENNTQYRDVELEREIAEKMVGLIQAQIPPVMYEDRISEIARDWAFRYSMHPEDMARHSGMSLEEYREGFREVAEKQVKFRLSLEKIAEIEGLQVSPEEIDIEFAKMAAENRMTLDKVHEIITPKAVESDLKTEKALQLLKDNAIIKDKQPKTEDTKGETDEL
jgi:trigger factor